jgi:peptidoglycan/LPS O-acetylase OafA/YrhL
MSSGARRFYRPELDVLRFFAFLCVFWFHRMDYVPVDAHRQPLAYLIGTAGAFGLPIFFFLSAFLIVELLLRERQQTQQIHIGSFYVRRILRIWPLYFLALFGLAALARVLPDVGPQTSVPLLWFSLFAGNWYIVHHGWIAGAFDPLWSISLEEQFYLAVPALLKFGGRRVISVLNVVLIAISFVMAAHYAILDIHGESGEWVNSWFQFQFFAAGALLALAINRIPRFPAFARWAMFTAGAGCWAWAILGPGVKSYDSHTTVTGAIYGWFLVLAGTALFFVAVLGIDERFVPEWLRYLGRISYGLYIFHSLVFHLVFNTGRKWLESAAHTLHVSAAVLGTTTVFVTTLSLASLSYHLYESPFLRLKRRFTFVPSRPGDGEAEPSPPALAHVSKN